MTSVDEKSEEKKIKHLFYACIVSLLFTACTEDHSFSLDERRQIIVVHNLAQLQISVAYFCSIGLYFLV